jgi:hypothetical protein
MSGGCESSHLAHRQHADDDHARDSEDENGNDCGNHSVDFQQVDRLPPSEGTNGGIRDQPKSGHQHQDHKENQRNQHVSHHNHSLYKGRIEHHAIELFLINATDERGCTTIEGGSYSVNPKGVCVDSYSSCKKKRLYSVMRRSLPIRDS